MCKGEALVLKRADRGFSRPATMQAMVRRESLTRALEAEHREELACDDAKLHGG